MPVNRAFIIVFWHFLLFAELYLGLESALMHSGISMYLYIYIFIKCFSCPVELSEMFLPDLFWWPLVCEGFLYV